MREMRKRMRKRNGRGRGGRKDGGRKRRRKRMSGRKRRWRRKIEYFGVSDLSAEIDDGLAHGQRPDDARVVKEGRGRRRGGGRDRGRSRS